MYKLIIYNQHGELHIEFYDKPMLGDAMDWHVYAESHRMLMGALHWKVEWYDQPHV